MFEKLIKWVTHAETNRSGVLATPTALVVDITRTEGLPEPIDHVTWQHRERAGEGPAAAVAFLLRRPDDVLITVVDVLHDTVAARITVPSDALGEFAATFLTASIAGRSPASRTLLFDSFDPAAGGDVPTTRPPRPPKHEMYRAFARELYRTQRLPVIFTSRALEVGRGIGADLGADLGQEKLP